MHRHIVFGLKFREGVTVYVSGVADGSMRVSSVVVVHGS